MAARTASATTTARVSASSFGSIVGAMTCQPSSDVHFCHVAASRGSGRTIAGLGCARNAPAASRLIVAYARANLFDQLFNVVHLLQSASEKTNTSFFSISCWSCCARSTSSAASLMFFSRSALRISSRCDLPLGSLTSAADRRDVLDYRIAARVGQPRSKRRQKRGESRRRSGGITFHDTRSCSRKRRVQRAARFAHAWLQCGYGESRTRSRHVADDS